MFLDGFLFYSSVFVIYCLPVLFVLIGLGMGVLLSHSYIKNYELSHAVDVALMCPVSILFGFGMMGSFWSASF